MVFFREPHLRRPGTADGQLAALCRPLRLATRLPGGVRSINARLCADPGLSDGSSVTRRARHTTTPFEMSPAIILGRSPPGVPGLVEPC